MLESTDKLALQLLDMANSYGKEPYNLICVNKYTLDLQADVEICTLSHSILGTVEDVFAPISKDIEAKNEEKIKAFCEKLAIKLAKLKTPIIERRITL